MCVKEHKDYLFCPCLHERLQLQCFIQLHIVVYPDTIFQCCNRGNAVKNILGITQIVIGTISVGCGIAAAVGLHSNWANGLGYAIWGGIWIIITGILATSSASYPNNRCLLGTSMAFNILSTFVAFFDGVIYAFALGYVFCFSLMM